MPVTGLSVTDADHVSNSRLGCITCAVTGGWRAGAGNEREAADAGGHHKPRMDDLDYLRLVDTRTRGQRYDGTPLFADAQAFARLIDDLAKRCSDVEYDVVAGIDA